MTIAEIAVIAIAAIPLGLVLLDRLRPDAAALTIAAGLGIAQFAGLSVLGPANHPLDAAKALAGLAQPVVITMFSLFAITYGLEQSGVTRWVARQILKGGATSETRLIALFTTSAAALSLLLSNLAAAALLLPSAMNVSHRSGIRPSKLLIPIAYGSLLGGAATYFTTANIIVSDLLTTAQPAQPPLHILDFTPTGGLMAIAGIAFISLYASRVLPDRAPSPEQSMVRHTSSELQVLYDLNKRLWEVLIRRDSSLVGCTLAQSGIGRKLGLAVIAIWHGRQAIFAPPPDHILTAGDILVITGRQERVNQLEDYGVTIGREHSNKYVSTRGVRFIEMILSPHTTATGATLRSLEFRRRYGFTAVALLRGGRSYRTDVADFNLSLGDSILLVGPEERLPALRTNPDFIVLETDVSDQPVYWRQASLVLATIVAAVVASIAGAPVHLAMLSAAVMLVLSGTLSLEQVYRKMEWRALFLIAGIYSLSLAMVNSGLADTLGRGVVKVFEPFGPLGLAAGAFLTTAVLTQFMGGQVTALVTGPIAISAAIATHANPHALAVATALGCSCSFLTPMAHPSNTLMIGPANYQFRDFFRLGWGLSIVCFVVTMIGMKIFWGL